MPLSVEESPRGINRSRGFFSPKRKNSNHRPTVTARANLQRVPQLPSPLVHSLNADFTTLRTSALREDMTSYTRNALDDSNSAALVTRRFQPGGLLRDRIVSEVQHRSLSVIHPGEPCWKYGKVQAHLSLCRRGNIPVSRDGERKTISARDSTPGQDAISAVSNGVSDEVGFAGRTATTLVPWPPDSISRLPPSCRIRSPMP